MNADKISFWVWTSSNWLRLGVFCKMTSNCFKLCQCAHPPLLAHVFHHACTPTYSSTNPSDRFARQSIIPRTYMRTYALSLLYRTGDTLVIIYFCILVPAVYPVTGVNLVGLRCSTISSTLLSTRIRAHGHIPLSCMRCSR